MEKTICGIRQGCPDGEYFVSDVKRKNNDLHFRKAVNNMKFQQFLYADDTLVDANKNTFAKEYIKFIEEESEYYSTKPNRKKCVCITFKRNNQITVPDGQP